MTMADEYAVEAPEKPNRYYKIPKREHAMSEDECFLITLFYRPEKTLLRCALSVKRGVLSQDCIDYPLEPENRRKYLDLLPSRVRDLGSIVDVSPLFDVHVHKSSLAGE